MEIELVDLSDEQIEEIESRLEEYDRKYITNKMSGNVSIGFIHAPNEVSAHQ